MIGTYNNPQPYGTLIANGNWRDGDSGPISPAPAALTVPTPNQVECRDWL